MYVMLEAVRQAARPRTSRADAIAAAAAGALPARGPRGRRGGVRRPADRRPGHHRRLQADHRGPRQPGPGRAAARQRQDRRPRQRHRRAAGPVQQFPGQHALAVPRHRPRPSAWPWACRSATSSTRLQVYLGSYYVNNFNEFGRTWQVNIQADPHFRDRGQDIRAASGAQQPGADGPPGHAAGRARHQRAGDGDALQHVLGHRHHRQRRARHQLRPGHRPDAGDRRPGTAAGRWRRTGPS